MEILVSKIMWASQSSDIDVGNMHWSQSLANIRAQNIQLTASHCKFSLNNSNCSLCEEKILQKIQQSKTSSLIMYFVQMNHNATVNSYHIQSFYKTNIFNKHLQLLDQVAPEKLGMSD